MRAMSFAVAVCIAAPPTMSGTVASALPASTTTLAAARAAVPDTVIEVRRARPAWICRGWHWEYDAWGGRDDWGGRDWWPYPAAAGGVRPGAAERVPSCWYRS